MYRMSNSCPAHPIADSLRRRRILYVCHMTPCHRLPSIFASGGLLSLVARRKNGVAEPEQPHDWGGEGKREALAGYVVCGFETPKWMCRKHPEDLAVILLAEGVSRPAAWSRRTNIPLRLRGRILRRVPYRNRNAYPLRPRIPRPGRTRYGAEKDE